MSDALGYLDANLERFREQLFDFLRIPSVSARSEHDGDMRRAAEWLRDRMTAAGLEASIEETPGHPVVLGEWRGAGDDAPTVLIYGHYDVQPPEPLELWTTPPFEPSVRDGRVYARGSVDDKGQLFLHVCAAEAHLKTSGRLPVNLVMLVEGEEEVGSDHLLPFLEEHAERLGCDYVVISDTTMVAEDVPTIGASLRGLAYLEVRITGPSHDLHSGSYGGAVVNPATALARIIATFHDESWHVAVPGFYDGIEQSAEFRRAIAEVPFDEAGFLADTGAASLVGEEGYTTPERVWIRPTVEVNGLLSGYTGEGPKTVLPSWAMAKVSCRLVAGQDPDRINRIMADHIRRVAPEGVSVDVKIYQAGHSWRASLGGPLYEAAERALEKAFGKPPVYAGEGGSIPIVPEFERTLDAPVLLMGFGLPGENAHAPDEWMSLGVFEKGMRAAALLLEELR
ncbi:MAG TPA: dipeptidase [Longimicrobiales bacterium]|nr:dipeptidase [Longimicrobiales bacterium]